MRLTGAAAASCCVPLNNGCYAVLQKMVLAGCLENNDSGEDHSARLDYETKVASHQALGKAALLPRKVRMGIIMQMNGTQIFEQVKDEVLSHT